MSFQDDLKAAIAACGLTPPDTILTNKSGITRFRSGPEKTKNGWYRLVILPGNKGDEIAFGSFGCWKRGINEKWSSKEKKDFTTFDNARYKREQERIRRQQEEDYMNAAMRAEKIWSRAGKVDKTHPYLERKGIKSAIGIRQHKDSLIIPARIDGKITSLQFINKEGGKLFLSGGKTAGAYCSIIQKGDTFDHIVICEGYATGVSIYEALRVPVVCAFFAGNLPTVAQAIRGKYPKAKITIAADNDQWSRKPDGTAFNAGIEKATDAANKIKASVQYPPFDPNDTTKPTDFNDLALRYGVSAIRATFDGNPPDLRVNKAVAPVDVLPAAMEGADWRNMLVAGRQTITGWPMAFDGKSKDNLYLFLSNHEDFTGLFVYNEFSAQVLLVKPFPWRYEKNFKIRPIKDVDAASVLRHLERFNIKAAKNSVYDYIIEVAEKNTINPPKEYFETLQWDGKPRLDMWLTYYLGAEKQPPEYLGAVGRKWMTAGVARVYDPGCKFDNAIILEGPQGVGKSRALRTLATFNGVEYFCDSIGDLKNKDTIMMMQGKLIIEMAELASFKKSENEEIKAFISRQVDEYRPPYGRAVEQRKRYFVLAGSTNETDDGYLTDRTGNRRYWPVLCGSIDNDGLERDKEQLWAEAVFCYKNKEKLYLADEIYDLATVEQKGRFVSEVWASKLKEKLIGKWNATLNEAAEMLELKPRDINNKTRNRIKDALKEIGWFETQRDGERIWKPENTKGINTRYLEKENPDNGFDLL